jgi:GR25 family glycosyltransferase involved in LPS biosynthesis
MESLFTCPAFIINLPRSRKRIPYIYKQLFKAGYMNVSVFDAVDGLDPEQVKEATKLYNDPKIDNIKPGAIGCLLSHMKLLSHIIENQIPLATIFEDDIHFHPEWATLSKHYYDLTPKDYEVLFIGNQLNSCLVQKNISEISEITTEYCYCMHAYVVTLEGAKKMLDTILNYKLGNGLCEVDCILFYILIHNKKHNIPPPFTLYSWNGTKYPCEYNHTTKENCRNTGLVFQNLDFVSQIDDSKIVRNSSKKIMTLL